MANGKKDVKFVPSPTVHRSYRYEQTWPTCQFPIYAIVQIENNFSAMRKIHLSSVWSGSLSSTC